MHHFSALDVGLAYEKPEFHKRTTEVTFMKSQTYVFITPLINQHPSLGCVNLLPLPQTLA